jgi:hypothetical protein
MVGLLSLALALTLHVAHPCLAAPSRGPSVPAPLVLHTSCGWFELSPRGRLARLPNHWGAKHGDGTGRRYGAHLDLCCDRTRHISLRLHGRLVWRSRTVYPGYGGQIAFGPHEFAFADYYRGVFLTDLRGPERLVVRGRGLYPYDFTRRGDLIIDLGRRIETAARTGRLLARYRFSFRNGFTFDEQSDTLYFVTPAGRLAAVHDRRLRLGPRVGGLGGISTYARGLLVFTTNRRIVVTRRDGTFLAAAAWNPDRQTLDSVLGVSPNGRSFVFELVTAPPLARSGKATLYIMHPGERHARVLFRGWRSPVGCHEGGWCAGEAGFDWHERFLMYMPGDGQVGLIDSRSGRILDLTRFDRSLPHLGPQPEEALIAWRSDFRR